MCGYNLDHTHLPHPLSQRDTDVTLQELDRNIKIRRVELNSQVSDPPKGKLWVYHELKFKASNFQSSCINKLHTDNVENEFTESSVGRFHCVIRLTAAELPGDVSAAVCEG